MREGPFELYQFTEEAIISRIRNLRPCFDIIQVVVPSDFIPELCQAGLNVGSSHRKQLNWEGQGGSQQILRINVGNAQEPSIGYGGGSNHPVALFALTFAALATILSNPIDTALRRLVSELVFVVNGKYPRP